MAYLRRMIKRNLNLTEQISKRLTAEARARGIRVSEMARRLLEDALGRLHLRSQRPND